MTYAYELQFKIKNSVYDAYSNHVKGKKKKKPLG